MKNPASMEALVGEVRAKRARLLERLRFLGSKPFEAQTSYGFVFASRDPREAGKPWRLTFFGHDKKPMGHMNYGSFEALAKDLGAYGVHDADQIKIDNWSLNPGPLKEGPKASPFYKFMLTEARATPSSGVTSAEVKAGRATALTDALAEGLKGRQFPALLKFYSRYNTGGDRHKTLAALGWNLFYNYSPGTPAYAREIGASVAKDVLLGEGALAEYEKRTGVVLPMTPHHVARGLRLALGERYPMTPARMSDAIQQAIAAGQNRGRDVGILMQDPDRFFSEMLGPSEARTEREQAAAERAKVAEEAKKKTAAEALAELKAERALRAMTSKRATTEKAAAKARAKGLEIAELGPIVSEVGKGLRAEAEARARGIEIDDLGDHALRMKALELVKSLSGTPEAMRVYRELADPKTRVTPYVVEMAGEELEKSAIGFHKFVGRRLKDLAKEYDSTEAEREAKSVRPTALAIEYDEPTGGRMESLRRLAIDAVRKYSDSMPHDLGAWRFAADFAADVRQGASATKLIEVANKLRRRSIGRVSDGLAKQLEEIARDMDETNRPSFSERDQLALEAARGARAIDTGRPDEMRREPLWPAHVEREQAEFDARQEIAKRAALIEHNPRRNPSEDSLYDATELVRKLTEKGVVALVEKRFRVKLRPEKVIQCGGSACVWQSGKSVVKITHDYADAQAAIAIRELQRMKLLPPEIDHHLALVHEVCEITTSKTGDENRWVIVVEYLDPPTEEEAKALRYFFQHKSDWIFAGKIYAHDAATAASVKKLSRIEPAEAAMDCWRALLALQKDFQISLWRDAHAGNWGRGRDGFLKLFDFGQSGMPLSLTHIPAPCRWDETPTWKNPKDGVVYRVEAGGLTGDGFEISAETESGAPLGGITLNAIGAGLYEVFDLWVDHRNQRRGIGTELYARAVAEARRRGAKIMSRTETRSDDANKLHEHLRKTLKHERGEYGGRDVDFYPNPKRNPLGEPARANPLDPICPKIGEAYLAMPDESKSERAKRLYAQYARETERLFKLIKLRVEFTTDDPYKTAAEMREDAIRHGRMKVFSGGTPHDLLTQEQNLRGRAVHDLLAHLVCGCPFTASGEYNAFEAQAALYSHELRSLLFTEIVGQSCAYVLQKGTHAEQKVLFLPDHLIDAAQSMRRRFKDGLGLAGVISRGWIDPQVLAIAESTGYALRYLYAVLENKPVPSQEGALMTNPGWSKQAVRLEAPAWARWL